jgi:Uma2 family endonuclease
MNAQLPASELKPHKLTVDELRAFESSGAFAGLPRMELLDGTLYEMSPQTSRHVVAKNELGFRLRIAVQEMGLPLAVLIEPTLSAFATSAPEPDIAILSQLRVEGYYPASLVRLAVEVAVTTVDTDLRYKKSLYAKAGIPEYWVVEVDAAMIHAFWRPQSGVYLEQRLVSIGDPIASASIPGLNVETVGLI